MSNFISSASGLPSRVSVILSYVICVNVCAFARNTLKIILWYVLGDSYNSHWVITLFNIASYSIMFFCGLLVGFLLYRHSIIHSSLSVALGVIFTYLISGIGPHDCFLIIEGALTGAFLGGIGGGCALIARKLL